jgi:hypothetical protein
MLIHAMGTAQKLVPSFLRKLELLAGPFEVHRELLGQEVAEHRVLLP